MKELFEAWAKPYAPGHWRFGGKHVRGGEWRYDEPIVQMLYDAFRAGRGSSDAA